MAEYRKKPVTIEARQWNPDDLREAGAVVGWLMAHGADIHHPSGLGSTTTLAIRTLEGEMLAQPGDWVIQGVQGEFYPCKPDIFEATYEPVLDVAREAGELHAEHHSGYIVPSLDSCPEHTRAEYEQLVRDLHQGAS